MKSTMIKSECESKNKLRIADDDEGCVIILESFHDDKDFVHGTVIYTTDPNFEIGERDKYPTDIFVPFYGSVTLKS